ncbi:hypothetical protein KJ599_08560, partial [bacterium]|nr:hypothetical protein [bacterium]
MSKKKVYVNLQGFLANVIVESLTRNKLFEKHYVSLATCISLLQLGYETGAVLGYASVVRPTLLYIWRSSPKYAPPERSR